MKRYLALIVLLICLPLAALANRVALVIGNSEYTTVSTLDNPGNDAAAVSAALRQQGFEVVTGDNLGREAMRDALRRFRSLADGAEVALVYYAGHGIEISGTNYLVPVDARLEDERDAGLEMIEVDLVLRQISGATTLKMVVLDACRNNPFVARMRREGSSRNVRQGLGELRTGEADTLIAYAAAAGEITPDGRPGDNSPFTSAFLAALGGPPMDVRRMLGQVRDRMRQSVPGAAPFVYSSLGGGEYVINPRSTGTAQVQAPTVSAPAAISISEDFVRIDRDGTLADWDAFLIRHEGQSDHPLYAFALEKRAALQVAATRPAAPSGENRSGRDQPETAAVATVQPGNIPADADQAARALQQVLKEQGCYAGAIDGILGRNSVRGLTEFSRRAGLNVSLPHRENAEGLERLVETLRAHPDVRCPRVARQSQPANAQTHTQARPVQTGDQPEVEEKPKGPVFSDRPCPLQEELKFDRPECH